LYCSAVNLNVVGYWHLQLANGRLESFFKQIISHSIYDQSGKLLSHAASRLATGVLKCIITGSFFIIENYCIEFRTARCHHGILCRRERRSL